MKLSTFQLVTAAAVLAVITMLATIAFAGDKPEPPALGVIRSWNAAVQTLEPEDANFHELLDSYQRFPPGAVVMVPDVRASQKQRRLKLIESIINSHRQRILDLEDLSRAEANLP